MIMIFICSSGQGLKIH